jgi:hypothetical protein
MLWNSSQLVRSVILAPLILAIVCLAFFFGHIRGTNFFNWDFMTDYHAPTAYIIDNLSRGIWPSWVSHQSLGFPLYMSLQSDLFYPPTWVIAALHVPYALWEANILQILHIYLGGLGAWRLARSYGMGHGALIVGCSYMLMGGFFLQSQHVDFVRGFCYAPWFLFALRIDRFEERPLFSSFFLATICALIVLGAYPGQVISSAIIGCSYVVAQLFLPRQRTLRGSLFSIGLMVLGAASGMVIGLPKYLPFLLDFSSEILRWPQGAMARVAATPELIFSTVLSTDVGAWRPLDVSSRSYFISAPTIFLAFMSRRETLLRLAPLLVASAVAALFALDFLTPLLGKTPLVLRFSRFPVSDYKSYLLLGPCLCAGSAFDYVLESSHKNWAMRALGSFLFFIIFYLTGVMLTAYFHSPPNKSSLIVLLGGLISASLTFASLIFYRSSSMLNQGGLALLIAGLIVLDAARVYGPSYSWNGPAEQLRAEQRFRLGYETLFHLPRIQGAFDPIPFRPKRLNVGHIDWDSWRGFFSNDFVYEGMDSSRRLRRHSLVFRETPEGLTPQAAPGIARFMQRPSTALLLAPNASEREIQLAVYEASLADENGPSFPAGISMRSFGDKEVIYEVNISAPGLLVENEMFWRGWSARLLDPFSRNPMGSIPAIETLQVLRSWELPSGHYLLCTGFEEPHLALSVTLTAICSTLLLSFFALIFRSHCAPRTRTFNESKAA